MGLNVRAKPGVRQRGARQHLGEAAQERRHLGVFLTRKRQELEDSHSPGHALCNPLHQGGLLQTGQQPASLEVGRGVDATADVGQKLERVLDLIEDDGKAQPIEEAARVFFCLGQGVGILEQAIVRLRPHELQQGGLAAATRTREQQSRETATRAPNELNAVQNRELACSEDSPRPAKRCEAGRGRRAMRVG